jgi:hypothetical protein
MITEKKFMKNEKIIAEFLSTSEGKRKLKKAMHLDTQLNFENFYGPTLDEILNRARNKYTQENYNCFVNNFISLCQ